MNNLWAPWRLQYVQAKKEKGCVFCRALKDSHDRKNLLLYRSKHCFIILNTFPYNNGHLMIVPNRHLAEIERLSSSEFSDMNSMVVFAVKLLKKTLMPGGFNIGTNIGKHAGAGIERHLHTHVVPRWVGDTNFMPMISNTKVIPQSLVQLYTRLKENL